MGTDPLLFGLVVSMHAGPEAAPAEALDGRFTAVVRG
jgi:hypothetical protein